MIFSRRRVAASVLIGLAATWLTGICTAQLEPAAGAAAPVSTENTAAPSPVKPQVVQPPPVPQTTQRSAERGAPAPSRELLASPAQTPKPVLWNLPQHPYRSVAFAAVALLILVGIGVLLYLAAQKPRDPFIVKLRASFFFWLGVGYTLILLLLALVYSVSYEGSQPYLIGELLPIAVPWFGALGAVTISLEGVFQWNQAHWNPEYNYWHLGRPVFGAVLGIVAFFLFVLIVSSSGTPPTFLAKPDEPVLAKDFIIYYVVAFLVGYREETFRELIRRATDLILKPGDGTDNQPAITFTQAGAAVTSLDFEQVKAGATKTLTVGIENTGKAALKSPIVMLDVSGSTEFTIANNQFLGSTELRVGEAKSVDVTFAPNAPNNVSSAALVATGSNLNAAAKLQLAGKS